MLLDPQVLQKAMYSTKLVVTSVAFSMWAFSADAVSIAPADAMTNVGRTATVCGVVASANYAVGTRANPTFLTVVNSDQSDPSRALTSVICGHYRNTGDGAGRPADLRDRAHQFLSRAA